MDHSTFIYLMDRNGEYLRHFPYGVSADDLATAVANAVASSG
jgi:protein SCO1/2